MKWYFVLNEQAHKSYFDVAKLAVLSCLETTSLQPHLLFDGSDSPFTDWMREKGAIVHLCQVPFINELYERKGERGLNPDAARGAYLRVMIPLIEKEDQYVLYTDTDVIFRSDPTKVLQSYKPTFIGATIEADQQDLSFFNSGVMLLNVSSLQLCSKAFIEFITQNLPKWNGFSPNDQGAYNYFFRGVWQEISNLLNWKPYWGVNDNALIVHYHGNRPVEVIKRMLKSYSNDMEKSAHRKASLQNPSSRQGLLTYNRTYYRLASRVLAASTTRIVEQAVEGDRLSLGLLIGEDITSASVLVLYVMANDEIHDQLEIEIKGKVGTVQRSTFTISVDPAQPLSLVGRDFPHIRTSAEAGFSESQELAFICSNLPPASGGINTEALCRQFNLLRVWTLPSLNVQISVDESGEALAAYLPPPKLRRKVGPYEVRSLQNCEIDGRGAISPCSGGQMQSPVHSHLNYIESCIAPSRLTGLKNLLIQAAGLYKTSDHTKLPMYCAEPNPTSAHLLSMLGFPTSLENSKIAGNKIELLNHAHNVMPESPPEAVDHLLRKHPLSSAPLTDKLIVLGKLPDYAIPSGYRVTKVRDKSLSREAIEEVASSTVIIVADEEYAPLILLAASVATVIHIKVEDPLQVGNVLAYACLRNLMYSSITISKNLNIDSIVTINCICEIIDKIICERRLSNAYFHIPSVNNLQVLG
jgi:hypothetical protein